MALLTTRKTQLRYDVIVAGSKGYEIQINNSAGNLNNPVRFRPIALHLENP